MAEPYGYIRKPFELLDIQTALEIALYKYQAERKLQASEEWHRSILQTAMAGFWLVDTQGRLLEVNATYCQRSGYSAPELLALRVSDLEVGETAVDIAVRIQKIMAIGFARPTMTTMAHTFLSRGFFSALALLGLLAIATHADDWPQFRGPNRDAVWAETGILNKDMPTDASPLIEGDLLIAFVGGKPAASVIAFDRSSGREVWRALEESLTHSSPMVIRAGGKRQLIVWTRESMTSLDPMTGKTHWAERLPTSADVAVATPVFHQDRLLIGGLMLKLDGEKPAVLWPETRSVSRRTLSDTSTPPLRIVMFTPGPTRSWSRFPWRRNHDQRN